MSEQRNSIGTTARRKLSHSQGMTLAELMIVVAILLVLMSLGFLGIVNYQRSLGQLERDGIARQIFVAAQNHLTAAQGEGYLGLEEPADGSSKPFGEPETEGGDIYYFLVNGNIDDNTLLAQMLPFGSIDEYVRTGGSYIIRYQKSAARVLDVFYCTRTGSPAQFNRRLGDGKNGSVNDYATLVPGCIGNSDAVKRSRRYFTDGSIVGWYGGESVLELETTLDLSAPKITVHNEEKLYVEVEVENTSGTDGSLILIVTGATSKAKIAYQLFSDNPDTSAKADPGIQDTTGRVSLADKYWVVLDDVTTGGLQFGNITAQTTEQFIPGEDLAIQAVAYSNKVLANIAYSETLVTNSLYGSLNAAQDTVTVANIRHLENLDRRVSNMDPASAPNIAHAVQTDSFSLITFRQNIRQIEKTLSGSSTLGDLNTVSVYTFSGDYTDEGKYLPIEPDYTLTYDGKNHSISDVSVAATTGTASSGSIAVADAGLFGKVTTVSRIENLELIDFDIKGTASAGMLAGSLTGTTVTNVLARNSTDAHAVNVTGATGAAGGLVGSINNGEVNYSAAAVVVSGGTAGGLIGTASTRITDCYSGGHTKNGSYKEWLDTAEHNCDVTASAGTAGGLVGNGSNSVISSSYSTCSVAGSTAGGFVGTISSTGSITNSYCAGLVNGTGTNPTVNAFLGSGTPTTDHNSYYSIVNEIVEVDGTGKRQVTYLEPGTDNIAALDASVTAYNTFVGPSTGWNKAIPYDAKLLNYYSGLYNLGGITVPSGTDLFVAKHYGDWPSPEVFFINEA